MRALGLLPEKESLEILFLGAHSDDIEIGCGGTVLELLATRPDCRVTWVVFSGRGSREEEARRSAEIFLADAGARDIRVMTFRDGFFPWHGEEVKNCFEALKAEVSPDLIFSHHREDRHQDHRLVAELTWNTFRDHVVLEYEVPKYDGELGQPNIFVSLSPETVERKIQLLYKCFPSQAERSWFDESAFLALLRLRGVESAVPDGHAEGFHLRKGVLVM